MKQSYPYGDSLRDDIERRLAAHVAQQAPPNDLKKAAVTLLVVAGERNEASVVLTRRPAHINRHRGQYALPGGRVDEGESITDAALREMREEIGVDLDETALLGRLDDFQTRSGYCITPLVAWGSADLELEIDPNEVEMAFRIPLWDLARPEIPELIESEGEHPVLCAKIESLGHRIFAPTAAILYQFREVALFGNDTRVAHYDQPRFAWK